MHTKHASFKLGVQYPIKGRLQNPTAGWPAVPGGCHCLEQ